MIVAIIPARGGSKGIKMKNIQPVAGKELIYWSIRQSQLSKKLDQFLVSTENDEIAKVAKHYGAEVHKRPEDLATDESKTIDLLYHIANERPEIKTFVVLQPTSPIRNDNAIDKALEAFEKSNCDTLATGHYCKNLEYGEHHNLRRQDIEGFFYDDGNIYIIDRSIIMKKKWSGDCIVKIINCEEQNLEIDSELDLFIVDKVLERRIQENRQSK